MDFKTKCNSEGEWRSVPMYKVHFAAENTGKTFAMTKSSIKFIFGYASYNDLAKGREGKDARGEEHEVEIRWSLYSGRRVVSLDGKQVHCSRSDKSKFDYTFKMQDRNHMVRIVCYAALPPRLDSGFQPPQYEMIFTNLENRHMKSFHTLPEIYQLERDVDSLYAKIRCLAEEPAETNHESSTPLEPAITYDLLSFDDDEPVQAPAVTHTPATFAASVYGGHSSAVAAQ